MTHRAFARCRFTIQGPEDPGRTTITIRLVGGSTAADCAVPDGHQVAAVREPLTGQSNGNAPALPSFYRVESTVPTDATGVPRISFDRVHLMPASRLGLPRLRMRVGPDTSACRTSQTSIKDFAQFDELPLELDGAPGRTGHGACVGIFRASARPACASRLSCVRCVKTVGTL